MNYIDLYWLEGKPAIKVTYGLDIDELKIITKDADEVKILATSIHMYGKAVIPEGHMEIMFYDDWKPIASIWLTPFFWRSIKENQTDYWMYQDEWIEIYSSKNISGCIEWINNSIWNSIVTLNWRTGVCWLWAYDCYIWTKLYNP